MSQSPERVDVNQLIEDIKKITKKKPLKIRLLRNDVPNLDEKQERQIERLKNENERNKKYLKLLNRSLNQILETRGRELVNQREQMRVPTSQMMELSPS